MHAAAEAERQAPHARIAPMPGFGGAGDVLCALREAEAKLGGLVPVTAPTSTLPTGHSIADDVRPARMDDVADRNAADEGQSERHCREQQHTPPGAMLRLTAASLADADAREGDVFAGEAQPAQTRSSASSIDMDLDNAGREHIPQLRCEARIHPELEMKQEPPPGRPTQPRSEYDALADLFLSPDQSRTMLHVGPTPHGTPTHATHGGPALRLTQPVIVEPVETHVPAQTAPVRADVQSNQSVAQPRVEGLILGHLPVLGGAWVSQYAKHVASTQHASVALVRLQEGQLSVDLVTPLGTQRRTQSRVGAAAHDPTGISLEQAIGTLREEAAVWLIRVDEVDESALAATPGLDCVTLLTGADDAAVVASYRTLKNLSRVLDIHARDGDPAELRVAILGADEAKAAQAEAKLRQGASTFLNTALRETAKIGKIGAGSTQSVYRATNGAGAAAQLAYVLNLVRARPEPVVESGPLLPGPNLPPAHALHPPGLANSHHTHTQSTRGAAHTVPSSSPPILVHASEPATELCPAGAASFAALLGFTACDVTCPYAPRVQLCWGVHGDLHLVQHVRDADCVQQLLSAAAWANDHRELLQRVHGRAAASSLEFGPTLHVLSDDIKPVRPLLDTAIRVHVLIDVAHGAQTLRIAKSMN